MEHTTESVIFLCGHLRNLGCNIYFLSKKGRFLGCSRPGCKLPASWMKQIHSAQWPGEEGAILSVSGNPYTLHLCPSTQGDSLCALIPSEDYQRMAPFLDVLLQLNQATVSGTLQSPAQQRNLLTSQLANFGSLTAELSASIQDLGYTPNAWRVAILCSISMTSDHHLKDAVQSAQINAGFFSDCMEAFDGYSQDDIFGSISNNQFLIFRSVSSGSALDNFKELDDFLTKLTEYLWEHQADNPVFGIGSAYNSLTQLNMSYREAAFLLTNHAFLQPNGSNRLFISRHLLEYLAHTHLHTASELFFRDYNELAGSHTTLADTVVALSQNDYVLSHTACAMGIHRNTILQRYAKLMHCFALNPVHQVNDRLLLRTMMLPRMCAITLNAGMHIQADSMQYIGLAKLSEVLYQISHGTMQINIHHISISGDNQQFLKIIGNNSLDLGICGCAALYSVTRDLTSLIEQPFLFDSVDQAFSLLNQLVLPLLDKELRNMPVVCPAFWVIGSRHITSRDEPIRIPEDLRGKSIRTMSTGSLYNYFTQIGAHPVSIAYNELHSALSTRVVDCQENPYVNILGIGLGDVQHYINSMVYYFNISPMFVSRDTWMRLTEEQQTYLLDAIRESASWLVQEQASVNRRCRSVLEQEKGMVVFEPSEKEKRLWLKEAKAIQKNHPLQKQLHTLRKAKEIYNATGSLGENLQELLCSISGT